uniref:Uncharacterized protein n=1 Tax=Anguilla anguilla TaxID=7936 RepID=A0A0E9Q4M3_ANGAN
MIIKNHMNLKSRNQNYKCVAVFSDPSNTHASIA